MDIRKATVKSFNPTTYRATLQVAGSLATWLEGVPVARNIPTSEMAVGRSCVLLLFDVANPQDAVVAAVYI